MRNKQQKLHSHTSSFPTSEDQAKSILGIKTNRITVQGQVEQYFSNLAQQELSKASGGKKELHDAWLAYQRDGMYKAFEATTHRAKQRQSDNPKPIKTSNANQEVNQSHLFDHYKQSLLPSIRQSNGYNIDELQFINFNKKSFLKAKARENRYQSVRNSRNPMMLNSYNLLNQSRNFPAQKSSEIPKSMVELLNSQNPANHYGVFDLQNRLNSFKQSSTTFQDNGNQRGSISPKNRFILEQFELQSVQVNKQQSEEIRQQVMQATQTRGIVSPISEENECQSDNRHITPGFIRQGTPFINEMQSTHRKTSSNAFTNDDLKQLLEPDRRVISERQESQKSQHHQQSQTVDKKVSICAGHSDILSQISPAQAKMQPVDLGYKGSIKVGRNKQQKGISTIRHHSVVEEPPFGLLKDHSFMQHDFKAKSSLDLADLSVTQMHQQAMIQAQQLGFYPHLASQANNRSQRATQISMQDIQIQAQSLKPLRSQFSRLSQAEDKSAWEQLSIQLVRASELHQQQQAEKQVRYQPTQPSKSPILRQMQPRQRNLENYRSLLQYHSRQQPIYIPTLDRAFANQTINYTPTDLILRVSTKNPSLVERLGHDASSRFLLDIHNKKVSHASSMVDKATTLEAELAEPKQDNQALMQESYRLTQNNYQSSSKSKLKNKAPPSLQISVLPNKPIQQSCKLIKTESQSRTDRSPMAKLEKQKTNSIVSEQEDDYFQSLQSLQISGPVQNEDHVDKVGEFSLMTIRKSASQLKSHISRNSLNSIDAPEKVKIELKKLSSLNQHSSKVLLNLKGQATPVVDNRAAEQFLAKANKKAANIRSGASELELRQTPKQSPISLKRKKFRLASEKFRDIKEIKQASQRVSFSSQMMNQKELISILGTKCTSYQSSVGRQSTDLQGFMQSNPQKSAKRDRYDFMIQSLLPVARFRDPSQLYLDVSNQIDENDFENSRSMSALASPVAEMTSNLNRTIKINPPTGCTTQYTTTVNGLQQIMISGAKVKIKEKHQIQWPQPKFEEKKPMQQEQGSWTGLDIT